jgi:uncharacterized protein
MRPSCPALPACRWLWLLLWLVAACAYAQGPGELQAIPALQARVTDLTATLDTAQREQLERKLAAFETERGTQIVILLVSTTQPEDIAAYANRVFNTWKPGRAGVGDGLLILVAKQDRKMRIEVARTLEGAVPDLAAKQIIDEVLTPRFRAGDFAGGLDLAADRLMGLVRGEGLPAPARAAPGSADAEVDWMNLGVLALIVVPVLGTVARLLLGHKLGTVATGAVIGWVAFSISASLVLAALAALVAMVLTFIAGTSQGAALLSSRRGHGHGGPWGGGGWGGGADSGGWGGGGGGFSSGGGGDGAGGGASGDW